MTRLFGAYPSGTHPALQHFLDSLTDQAVFTLDRNGLIATWSEACQTLKGYTAEEAIGHPLHMIYTPEDRAIGHAEDNLRRAAEDGQFHEEAIRVRKGDERFMAEVSIYPIHEDGRVVGFSKIVRDVTKRRRLEDERDDLNRRLQKANLELEGFCRSVAHDLRVPIHALVHRSQIVVDEFGTDLPVELRGHMDAMHRSSVRLGRLVDDLLTFAKLGQDEIVRRKVDMSAVARRLSEEIKPCHHEGRLKVDVQEGVSGFGGASMIELVLSNLIENACKYSNPGVHVRFGMEIVDGESVYSVRDDGIGFDMRYVDRIFEPFERLHGISAYKGTGIGLANVRRIVERHGGKVWAQSVPGHGATFSFTLG